MNEVAQFIKQWKYKSEVYVRMRTCSLQPGVDAPQVDRTHLLPKPHLHRFGWKWAELNPSLGKSLLPKTHEA